MALPPQFDEPALRGLRRIDAAVGRGQARVFRVMWFMVPPGSVAWNLHFQALLASRFLSDVALQALLYGALIQTARSGEGAVQAALLGVAYLVPGVAFAMHGGAVADALPKRVALAGAYLVMGLLCLLMPGFLGTGFWALFLILLAVRTLHQVSQPSEAAAVPLVATKAELASATSFLSFASSAGEVVGKALLAPFVVRTIGVEPVVVLAGLLFLLSSTRVLQLDTGRHGPVEEGIDVRVSNSAALRWLMEAPSVPWMLLLAALASTIGVVLGVLGPEYARSVLDVEPANAFYVFAPAPIGLVAALALAPMGIDRFGERAVTRLGFALVAFAMVGFGLVEPLAGSVGHLVPLDIPGVDKRVEVAALMSVLLGFGATAAAAGSQTYMTRYVPLSIMGRTSALLGALKDGMAIPALLLLGGVADLVGVRAVIVAAPVFLVALAVSLDRLGTRWREGRLTPSMPRRRR